MMSIILETKDLTKRYKSKAYGEVTAVDRLNLSIHQGTCFGLLGPNGAGKTTTLEMIEGILPPSHGEILFKGKRVNKSFKEHIGIQFQSTSLPDRLYVHEVLVFFASLYKKTAHLQEIAELCDLGEFYRKDPSQLSGGQRQRLLLAIALVNDPELVFLDEPTTGLDPQARRKFWDLVALIKKKGKTIVLTTHYMDEAYELCDEIAIMDHGHIIAQGSPDGLLREHFNGLSIRIPKTSTLEAVSNLPSSLVEALKIQRGEIFDREEAFEIQTETPDLTMRVLLDHSIPLQGIQIRTKNLEDLFLKLTGKGFEC